MGIGAKIPEANNSGAFAFAIETANTYEASGSAAY